MPTHAELAGRLLNDAAAFFRTIAEQNPELAEQMRENASVFTQVGTLVQRDPLAVVEDDGVQGDSKDDSFTPRVPWVSALQPAEVGDRVLFGPTMPWVRCDDDARLQWRALLKEQGVEGEQVVGKHEHTLIDESIYWVADLPFYPEGKLLHLVVPSSEQRLGSDGFFLSYRPEAGAQQRRLRAIRNKVHEIHVANRDGPLTTEGHDLDYLMFFMHFSQGEEGMFRVLREQTLEAVKAILEANGVTETEQVLTPPRILGVTPDGRLRWQVYVTYAGAVFGAKMHVSPHGDIEMADDLPMTDQLDALRQRPSSGD